MNKNFLDMIAPMIITLAILLVFEIVLSTIFPMFGMEVFRLPFSIIIVLYLGFKIENPFLGIYILLLQYVHSFFSIEGWAMGTVTGISIWLIVSYVRELLHFSSKITTAVVTQFFQMLWLAMVLILIYMKSGSSSTYIAAKALRFIPESIIMSIIAPFFFILLDKVWNVKEDGASLGQGL